MWPKIASPTPPDMLVGVDIGTQSLKAAVLSPDLQIAAQRAIAYAPDFPKPGWAEQDPALWERALKPAILGALSDAGLQASEVRALGLAGQLDGCIPTDQSGAATGPCLIWMDRRASEEIADIDPGLIRERCGVVLDASHMAAKIRWLKLHGLAGRAVRRFHSPVSFLLSRLTGQHVIDPATASTSMVYGLKARSYDAELLAAFGLEFDELPKTVDAEAIAGELTQDGSELTGLPVGLPVATGTGDDFSSALGAGLIEPGCFLNVLGTAEVVGALHAHPLIDARSLVETHAFPSGHYFIENPGWLSGGALAWFRDAFRLKDFAELDRLAGEVAAGCDGVTFIPALSGAMAPEWIASARGTFFGLTPSHGTGHLARAVLEGTAFAMRDVLTRVVEMGMTVDRLRVTGGGAKSDVWRQIRADLTGLPVEQARHSDSSPVGAAMLAAVGIGLFADLKEAAKPLNFGLALTEPLQQNRSAYDDAYGRYRRVFDSLRPLF